MITIPPYLKNGDRIGITCPSGFMEPAKASACVRVLQQWGFEVALGETLKGHSKNYFSGTDEERAAELQSMLDDKAINAILFGRGGYGMVRIIDRINFRKFSKHPKWLIGYSDITVMHTHLLNRYKTASLHAPMAGAFNDFENAAVYKDAWLDAVTGKRATYAVPSHAFNRKGTVTGELVGGNLCLLSNMIGTPSDFDCKNRILFIEDIGEYLYNIDRMLYHLKRSGKFEKLAGLVVGGFTDLKDTERPFGANIAELIRDLVAAYEFPVCFDFPVSHTTENLPLKIGVTYELKVGASKCHLKEL